MENNLENKARFFAHYWGQLVAVISKGSYTHPLGTEHVVCSLVIDTLNPYVKHKYALSITPLSLISDEDAIEVAQLKNICLDFDNELFYPVVVRESLGVIVETHSTKDNSILFKTYISNDGRVDFERPNGDTIDFLRSKGYAVPYMELSVKTLVEYGWVKLKGVDHA